MITRRRFVATSALASLFSVLPHAKGISGVTGAPWRNWSGALVSHPKARLSPASEDELIAILKQVKGTIRPVGAGHSFSALVPTDDNLLILDQLDGLIATDKPNLTATLGAGMRLSDAGPLLDSVGQAMINLPDIDRQTLAGALATSTHGTGKTMKSMSGYLTGLRLVTPGGEIKDLSENNEPDLFNAARVSLGALGVITRVTFQNREPFNLRTRTWVEETESVVDKFDVYTSQYEHFEMMPMLHSEYSFVIANEETNDPVKEVAEEDSGDFLSLLDATPVMLRGALIRSLASDIEPAESVGKSYDALTNLRFDRFNEMEYSLPVEAGPECLREILRVVADESIDVVIPLEYRIIEGDDTWLGMCAGGPRVSISVHRMAGYDHRPYFDRVEPIFWKYGGRPHWGKVHTLGYEELSALYPRLDDFIALQQSVDPNGRMLNAHLKKLFGYQVN